MVNNYKTYKYIKNAASLNKYDGGTPGDSGRQLSNSQFVQMATMDKQMDPIQGISNKEILAGVLPNVQQSLNPILSGLGTVMNNARQEGINAAANVGKEAGRYLALGEGATNLAQTAPNLTQEAAIQAGKDAAKEATKTGLRSKVLGAAGNVAAVYNGVAGTLGLVNTLNNKFDITSGKLADSAAEYKQTFNGVYAPQIGGIDMQGVKNYLESWKKRTTWEAITKGAQAGSALSIINPIAGIAGLIGGGALGGLLSRRSRKKAEAQLAEAQRTFANVSTAFNRQEASNAATQGLQNEFNATHADKGLRKCDDGLALVNDKEVVGEAKPDKNGNMHITNAHTVDSPFGRADVKLANVDPVNGFVIGHKYGPDGVELNEKARVYERLFNSNNPYFQKIGEEGLLATLNDQDHAKDNNPKPQYAKDIERYANGMPLADKGLNMRKYDPGKRPFNWSWAAIPLTVSFANEEGLKKKYAETQSMPTTSLNAYAPNPYASQMAALMPMRFNIEKQLAAINDEQRYAKHAIDQSAYSPGQKMAMLSSLTGKKMKAIVDALNEKQTKENEMRSNFANFWSNIGAQEQQLMSAYKQKWWDGLAQANARKYGALETLDKSIWTNRNDLAQNLQNALQASQLQGLYEQELNNRDVARIAEIEENARKKYATPIYNTTQPKYTSNKYIPTILAQLGGVPRVGIKGISF